MQVKADFLAGPERPATPRGSQSAKVAAADGKAAACNAVSVPGEAWMYSSNLSRRVPASLEQCAQQLHRQRLAEVGCDAS